jgi:acetylserotonin N-methyltransferase
MFTAVRLGVFDALAEQSADAATLALSRNVNVDTLCRLLDACVGLGLLSRDGNQYRNTAAASEYLVSSSPSTLAGYVLYSDRSLYALWGHLDDAIREGTHRWIQTFGSREALFDFYFRDETATASFLGGMHGFGQLTSDVVVRAFDLGSFRHLVDLGGATGHLTIAACQTYANLRATVFDLPPVQKYAEIYINRNSVADRLRFVAGDFFADDLPKADLYALGRILHDWDEAKINLLLRKIYESLPIGGGLLIAESLLQDDRSGPLYTQMQDLNMLVCTEGKERTAGEYEAVLKRAGFPQIEHRITGATLDAILAIKS